MLLSIGMIVKNEEKYLHDCLSAIKPILESIDSELIIVDTGSTDRTVEIAEEFTDKVLHFEWINDFAAARNVGLKAAQGEWFMFLDADEIFISCDGIIDFFRSGSYKEYNSAMFSIRSYKSLDNKIDYTDFYLPRLTKMFPETAFVNPVHEALRPFKAPIMILNDVADHYGYAFGDDEEKRMEKFKRNSELLQQRLESEEKNDPLLYSQLFDTYCFLDDKTQAIEYAYKGIEVCKEKKSDFIMALYHGLIVLAHSRKEHDDVLRICDEYFAVDEDIRNGERSCDLEMLGFKGLSLFDLGRYEESYETLIEFFGMRDSFNEKGLVTPEAIYFPHHLKNENALLKLNMIFTEVCLKTERYNQAIDNFKQIPLKHYSFSEPMRKYRIEQIVQLSKVYDAKEFVKTYRSYDNKDRKDIFNAIRLSFFGMDEIRRRELINKFASIELDNAVQRNAISIHKSHFIGGAAGESRLLNYIEKFGAANADILTIMLKEKLDISPFLAKCESIIQMVADGFRFVNDFCNIVSDYDVSKINDKDQLYKLIVLYLYTVKGAAENKFDMSGVVTGLSTITMQYLETRGEAALPEEVIAAVTITEIEMLRKMRNYKECIASLRKLIQINSSYASIAKEYQIILKQDMQL